MRKLWDFIAGANDYGKLVLLVGVLTAIPLIVLPFYPQEAAHAWTFVLPASILVGLGILMCQFAPRKEENDLEWQSPMQRGSRPVLFAWCLGFVAGAVPFVLAGQLDFFHALFESISGWTTTGLTRIDVNELPHIYLFHRSFMQYCGGLGFIMVMVTMIQGKRSVNMFAAEGHSDMLTPSVRRTAQVIFVMYNTLLVVGVVLYNIFGMGLFDAFVHTMSALSTAGFTTDNYSIGHYNSIAIEMVTIFLMIVGASNFGVLLLCAQGRLKQVFRISEVRFMFAMLAVTIPIIAFSLMAEEGLSVGESFRQSAFGVVSTYSTTGYSTAAYNTWPPFAVGILIILMIVGGSIGSTAGGVKLVRVYLMFRIMGANIAKRLSPKSKVRVSYYTRAQGKTRIDDETVADTAGFVMCYIVILFIGTLMMTVTQGCTFEAALYEFASAFGTVGVSNGITAAANPATLLIEMVAMVLGRLEIFIVLIGIYSAATQLANKARAVVMGEK